jgi:branched-chain amino acid transport system substrate-binding protein
MSTTAIVLIIAGLVISGAVGYYLMPTKTVEKIITTTKNPLQDLTIPIGMIAASDTDFETYKPLMDKITTVDINNYLKILGYNTKIIINQDSAVGQAQIHLEKVQSFHSQGTNLIIGGSWSGLAQASLSYVNSNNMLLVSPGSTSPTLAIANDNLYRLAVCDVNAAPAIAQMISSWPIKAVIFIQRGDTWADGIYAMVAPELTKRNVEIIDRIRYTTESTEFANYLTLMDGKVATAIAKYGASHVGVMTSSFDEIVTIISQAQDFSNLKQIIWFGHESAGRNPRVVADAPIQGVQFRLFSTNLAPTKSHLWNDLMDRLFTLTKYVGGGGHAASYDAAWIITKSVLEGGSADPLVVKAVLPGVAKNYFGAMGWEELDANGDLKPSSYDIWGYGKTAEGKVAFMSFGTYNFVTGVMSWNDGLLNAQGTTRPTG